MLPNETYQNKNWVRDIVFSLLLFLNQKIYFVTKSWQWFTSITSLFFKDISDSLLKITDQNIYAFLPYGSDSLSLHLYSQTTTYQRGVKKRKKTDNSNFDSSYKSLQLEFPNSLPSGTWAQKFSFIYLFSLLHFPSAIR